MRGISVPPTFEPGYFAALMEYDSPNQNKKK